MSLYINYDEDFIIDLTPEEILENEQLENQYFYNSNKEQGEVSTENSSKDESTNQYSSENMFFDLDFYQFNNLQTPNPISTAQTADTNSKSATLKHNTNQQKKKSFSSIFAVPPPKPVSSAWLNLSLNKSASEDLSTSNKHTSFNDKGVIDPKFRRTHMTYAEKKNLKKQKIEKERENEIMEMENETATLNDYELDVFYKEEIRRPLAGIHVDINEKYEIDW